MGDILVGEYTVSKQNEVTVIFKEDVELDPNLEGSINIDVTSIAEPKEKTKQNEREESLPKDDSTSSEKTIRIKKPLKRNKAMKMNY